MSAEQTPRATGREIKDRLAKVLDQPGARFVMPAGEEPFRCRGCGSLIGHPGYCRACRMDERDYQ